MVIKFPIIHEVKTTVRTTTEPAMGHAKLNFKSFPRFSMSRERINFSLYVSSRAPYKTATYFKKDFLAVTWDSDGKLSFSRLVGEVEAGTSDRRRELDGVIQRVFVAVKSPVFQHTKPFHPFLSDTRRLDADVDKTWYNH